MNSGAREITACVSYLIAHFFTPASISILRDSPFPLRL